MYQATSMKLEGERDELSTVVAEAQKRLDEGLPPTADAERDWQRMERERDIRDSMIAKRQELERVSRPGYLHTTAEPRPNAYISEDFGLPKPYGANPPFKPSEAGASMRFITKPQPREIQI